MKKIILLGLMITIILMGTVSAKTIIALDTAVTDYAGFNFFNPSLLVGMDNIDLMASYLTRDKDYATTAEARNRMVMAGIIYLNKVGAASVGLGLKSVSDNNGSANTATNTGILLSAKAPLVSGLTVRIDTWLMDFRGGKSSIGVERKGSGMFSAVEIHACIDLIGL
jgi:hypothetical protein